MLNSVSTASEDSFGFRGTPLLYATVGNQPDIVYSLLTRGANVDAKSSRGITALHLACLRGYVECASLLINFGAKMNIADNFGNTPINILRDQNSLELKPQRLAITTYYKKCSSEGQKSIALLPQDIRDKQQLALETIYK